jgi:hypothetical protein
MRRLTSSGDSWIKTPASRALSMTASATTPIPLAITFGA